MRHILFSWYIYIFSALILFFSFFSLFTSFFGEYSYVLFMPPEAEKYIEFFKKPFGGTWGNPYMPNPFLHPCFSLCIHKVSVAILD